MFPQKKDRPVAQANMAEKGMICIDVHPLNLT